MKTKIVPASEWEETLQNRWKAREALKKVESIREKRRQQEKLLQQLESQLYESGYEGSDLYLHRTSGAALPLAEQRALREGRCIVCGHGFHQGEHVREYLDDAGNVVARYHLGCR